MPQQQDDGLADILKTIVRHKRGEVEAARPMLDALKRRADARAHERRDFRAALTATPPAIIAEIKKASPSKGVFAGHADVAAIARAYEAGGAAALSVLTDRWFFHGTLADLETARRSVTLPVLRKDFTIDAVQVVEAAAHGADAILLIAAILDAETIARFQDQAAQYGMAAIVEVHDADDLERAIAAGAAIIGVNNRNLRTFAVSLTTSETLAARIPAGAVRISESGIATSDDIRRLSDAGYGAFLCGEHLMRAPDPAAALRAMIAG
jgi:indole-3-glycerol phosphate synthase